MFGGYHSRGRLAALDGLGHARREREDVPDAMISEKQYQLPTTQGGCWTVVSEAGATGDRDDSWVGVARRRGRCVRRARYAVAVRVYIAGLFRSVLDVQIEAMSS